MTKKLDFDDTLPQNLDAAESGVPPHVIRSGKWFLWCFIALPMGLYALIVFFAPVDVLDQLPRVRRWADGVHAVLLAFSSNVDIYKHAHSTGFPQVAMLASALAVSIVIWIAVTGAIRGAWITKYNEAALARLYNRPDGLAGFLVVPLFGIACMWAFFCMGGDPSFAAGYTTQGRAGYWFISSISILFGGVGLATWPTAILRLLVSIFSRDKS